MHCVEHSSLPRKTRHRQNPPSLARPKSLATDYLPVHLTDGDPPNFDLHSIEAGRTVNGSCCISEGNENWFLSSERGRLSFEASFRDKQKEFQPYRLEFLIRFKPAYETMINSSAAVEICQPAIAFPCFRTPAVIWPTDQLRKQRKRRRESLERVDKTKVCYLRVFASDGEKYPRKEEGLGA
jgi:hypothetical protein